MRLVCCCRATSSSSIHFSSAASLASADRGADAGDGLVPPSTAARRRARSSASSMPCTASLARRAATRCSRFSMSACTASGPRPCGGWGGREAGLSHSRLATAPNWMRADTLAVSWPSSTKPFTSIWYSSSTRLALKACSAEMCRNRRASVMAVDLVVPSAWCTAARRKWSPLSMMSSHSS